MPRTLTTESKEEEKEMPSCSFFGQYDKNEEACQQCGIADECKENSTDLQDDLNSQVFDDSETLDNSSDDFDDDDFNEDLNDSMEKDKDLESEIKPKKKGRPKGSKSKKNKEKKMSLLEDIDILEKEGVKIEKPTEKEIEKEIEKPSVAKNEGLSLTFNDISFNISENSLKNFKNLIDIGLLACLLLHESLNDNK